jgi:hypothetical protein
MAVDVVILPRGDLDPDGFNRLAQVLRGWCAVGYVLHVDEEGLSNLDAGGPPRTAGDRHLDRLDAYRCRVGLPPLSDGEREDALACLVTPDYPDARARREALLRRQLSFPVRTAYDTEATEDLPLAVRRPGLTPGDRERLIASLRRHVPAELVEDIIVGDASWEEA